MPAIRFISSPGSQTGNLRPLYYISKPSGGFTSIYGLSPWAPKLSYSMSTGKVTVIETSWPVVRQNFCVLLTS